MIDTLGVAAAGDPRDRKTWSGTPKELIDSAERQGREVVTFSGQKSAGWDNLLYLPSVIRYGAGARRFRHYYGPFHRHNLAAYKSFRSLHENVPIIHTDYMWLDPDSVSSKDYLYRDCGWSNWSQSRGLSKNLAAEIGDRFSRLVANVGHVFTTSEWAKSEIVAEGAPPERVTVVGTGVGNFIRPYEGPKNYGNGMTLCVAKVRHRDKGVDLLLKGFALARERRPDLSLHLVVPPGSVRPAPGLYLHSNLPATELISLYREASLYAMPARNEPYGLVYLEAQLAGMAILGSPQGAFPEFAGFGENGFIVDSLTPHAVAEALLEAHKDPDQLKLKGCRGRAQASEASWDKTVRAILDKAAES